MDKKKIDLTLFVVSFGALMVLMLTRLSFVLDYSFPKGDVSGSAADIFYRGSTEALPEAQILGVLMIALAVSSIIFLVRLLKSS